MILDAMMGKRDAECRGSSCGACAVVRVARRCGILLFVILACAMQWPELHAQPTWIQLQTPTTRDMHRVYFLDSLKGWVAGDSGTIMRTKNGGRSWTVEDSRISTPITELFMLNERLGWALSSTPWTGSNSWYGTTLLTTTDGGDDWTSKPIDSIYYYSIVFLDSLHGCMGGDGGSLVRTTNGGVSWVSAQVPLSYQSTRPINRIKFFSPSTGYAVGGSPEVVGVVWKTTDGGENWNTTSLQDEMFDLDFSDSLNIICVGGGPDDGAEIARTTDAGAHWQFRYLGFPRFYRQAIAISFRTAAEAWSLLGSPGGCTTTPDSGNTWNLTTIRKGVALFDVMFTDERHGYAAGSSGIVLQYNAPFLVPVAQNWNMVSLPCEVADYRKSLIFPSAVSSAFTFSQTGYQVKDTLANHLGYWVKFAGAEIVPISGVPVYTDTFFVTGGWNMVGSITDPVTASSITTVGTTILTPFYAYHGGYRMADTISPGKGYWVKVDTSGMLVLSSTFSEGSGLPREVNESSLINLSSLRFEDGHNNSQTLYFGEKPDGPTSVGRYDLPPVPVEGMFDVRFASQRLVEFLSVNGAGEAPICISSAVYPLSISWDIKRDFGKTYLEVGVRDIGLEDGGKTMVSDATSPVVLKLMGKKLPERFALYQNYPNPFNPMTIVSFVIGHSSLVTLRVYDILGQEVATLVNEMEDGGSKSVVWDASGMASGIYYCRLTARPIDGGQAGTFTETRKLLLVK